MPALIVLSITWLFLALGIELYLLPLQRAGRLSGSGRLHQLSAPATSFGPGALLELLELPVLPKLPSQPQTLLSSDSRGGGFAGRG